VTDSNKQNTTIISANNPPHGIMFDFISKNVSINPLTQVERNITVNAPFFRTYRIYLYPSLQQLNLIKLWLDDVIDVYNITLSYVSNIIQPHIDKMVNNFIIIYKCRAIDNKIFQNNKKNANNKNNKNNKNIVDDKKKKLEAELKSLKNKLAKAKKSNRDHAKFIRNTLSFIDVRDSLSDIIKNIALNNKCERHTLDQSVKHCISMFKSAFTNFIEGNIKKFKIKPLSKSNNRKQMFVEAERIGGTNNVNSLYIKQLGDFIGSSRKLCEFKEHTCTLQYNKAQNTLCILCPMEIVPKKIIYKPKLPDATKIKIAQATPIKTVIDKLIYKLPGKFQKPPPVSKVSTLDLSYLDNIKEPTLHIKKKKEFKRKAHRNECEHVYVKKPKCGIDMGLRTFLSCYDGDTTLEICNQATSYPVIEKFLKRIDRLKQYMLKGTLSKNRYKKLRNRIQKKMRNRIDDMHNKVASFLTKRYQVINIGNVSVKSIISKKNNMSRWNKRICLTLSLYRFRKKLEEYGLRRGCVVNVVSEYMTSKMCSECGAINDMKASKDYICGKCGLKTDRDTNAAKNIWKQVPKEKKKKVKRNAITNKIK
jgi:transposase